LRSSEHIELGCSQTIFCQPIQPKVGMLHMKEAQYLAKSDW